MMFIDGDPVAPDKVDSDGQTRIADVKRHTVETSHTTPHWDGPALSEWEPWAPREVHEVLMRAAASWYVVGGWAIDLWLGRHTRKHGDIEIALPRAALDAMRHHLDTFYKLHAAGNGETFALNPADPFPETSHQCWVLEPSSSRWRLDIMLNRVIAIPGFFDAMREFERHDRGC